MNLKSYLLFLILICGACSQQRYAHREKVKFRPKVSTETDQVEKLSSPSPENTPLLIEAESVCNVSAPANLPPVQNLKDSLEMPNNTLPKLAEHLNIQVQDSTTSSKLEEPPVKAGFLELALKDMLLVLLVVFVCFILGLAIAIIPTIYIIVNVLEITLFAFILLVSLTLGLTLLFSYLSLKILLANRLKFSSILILSILFVLLFFFVLPFVM